MRTPRNQLIIAIVFALVLGLIIVVAARCSSSGAPAVRTPTATKTTGTPGRVTGTVTVVPGRATDVTITPPGGAAAPTPTQITVGPLPATSPITQTTGSSVQPSTSTAPTPVPAPVAQPPVAVPAGGTTHVVKAGETLGGIAKMYGTTTTAIAQANNLANPSLIRTGQRLVIPGVSGPVSGSTSTGSRTYIVQRGDNLSRIAAKYGVTVDAIVKANNLKNASLIYAGQKLIIP